MPGRLTYWLLSPVAYRAGRSARPPSSARPRNTDRSTPPFAGGPPPTGPVHCAALSTTTPRTDRRCPPRQHVARRSVPARRRPVPGHAPRKPRRLPPRQLPRPPPHPRQRPPPPSAVTPAAGAAPSTGNPSPQRPAPETNSRRPSPAAPAVVYPPAPGATPLGADHVNTRPGPALPAPRLRRKPVNARRPSRSSYRRPPLSARRAACPPSAVRGLSCLLVRPGYRLVGGARCVSCLPSPCPRLSSGWQTVETTTVGVTVRTVVRLLHGPVTSTPCPRPFALRPSPAVAVLQARPAAVRRPRSVGFRLAG